jgi:shikimate dehydrogenase
MSRPPVSGMTRLAAVIGDPVRHSRSPLIHNAAYDALDLDWVYVALPVAAGHGFAAVRSMVDLGISGLNVTMPHKTDAADACDELTPEAEALRSVNTVVLRDNGVLLGASTDGEGFMRSLADEGVSAAGKRVLIIGAGGAGRAVAHSLGVAGANVTVAARRIEAAREASLLAPEARSVLISDLDALIAESEIIVNATPVGMASEAPTFNTDLLTPAHLVCDLVYQPALTPLLDAAERRSASIMGGIGMLLHQAAVAFEMHTGQAAPMEAMREAISLI